MTQTIALALLGFALGIALGLAHFASLRRVTAMYLSGGSPSRAVLLQLARLSLLGGMLLLFAQFGAAPLLASALGVLIAREIVLRRARKEATWTAH